jgi:hypothetical protein
MRYTLGVLLALAAVSAPGAKSQCAVEASPRVALPPLRFIRVKVTIEDRGLGRLELNGPEGLETASQVQAGPRTTWIEWKNVVLGDGDYEVDLLTASGCRASARIKVGTPEG